MSEKITISKENLKIMLETAYRNGGANRMAHMYETVDKLLKIAEKQY